MREDDGLFVYLCTNNIVAMATHPVIYADSFIYINFMRKKIMLIAALLSLTSRAAAQHIWTLEECIDHAVGHNISLQKARANMLASAISISEQRGALLPSVSASV